ncbi:hypothetical protein GJ744_005911 [Endocarpon pusillum]|uniref:Uncharacterized protein n=1 Tax=Endocarpon pusillum TaxID=364733 RepID=A0A8H7APF8_9EURO|nr:hypothetical protein GJ744_005911 [Endocarpon pusillum]
MQTFGDLHRYYGSYAGPNSTLFGRLGDYCNPHHPWLSTPPWHGYSAEGDPTTNPAAFSSHAPFCLPDDSQFRGNEPGAQLWSGRNSDQAILWSRGISSPCFRHDHHVIVQSSNPPFSAGNCEIDRRHMIEVQFDQFGVASHCRSTRGRMGPWRANRYRYSVEEAYSKLQMEIMTLMSRLGLLSNGPMCQGGGVFEEPLPPWTNAIRQNHPLDDYMNVRSVIPPAGFSPPTPTLLGPYSGFRSDAWGPFLDPFGNYS